MTREDKELLLRDLCARLPYGVKIYTTLYGAIHLNEIMLMNFRKGIEKALTPYLRPMSSMTEEELREFKTLEKQCESLPTFAYISVSSCILFDWLNSHHFDYRGLIECGLAIEVTEENNPYENRL